MKNFIKTKAASLAEMLICLGVLGIILTLLTPVFTGNMRSPGITAYFKDYSKVGVCRNWNVDGTCNEKFGYKIYTTQNLKYEGMRIKADGTPVPTSKNDCLAIRDVADLLRIQNGVTSSAGCYIMMDDINFEKTQVLNENGHKEWVPLADAKTNCNNGTYRRCKPITNEASTQYNYVNAWTGIDNFSGIFLGNGKILYKLRAPLFKTLKSSAIVQDFGIQDSNINGSGASSVGFLANNVTNDDDYKLRIKNVYLKNSKITGASGIQSSGGLIGKSEAELELKYAYKDSPQQAAAGLVGWATKDITFDRCSVENSTTAANTVNAGGLLGFGADAANITIKNSSNYKGNVTGKNAGGLIGRAEKNVTIELSWSNAEITGNDTAGGFVGHSGNSDPSVSTNVRINKSYTMGRTNANQSGGFVGHVHNNLTLNHVYTAVIPSGTQYVGYILGYNEKSSISGNHVLNYKSDETISSFGFCNAANTDTCGAAEVTPISIKKSLLNKYKFDDISFKAEDFDKSTWLFGSVRPILKDNKEIVETDELTTILPSCDGHGCIDCQDSSGSASCTCTGGGCFLCNGGTCIPDCSSYNCAECNGQLGTEGCTGGAGSTACSGGLCKLPSCNTFQCSACQGRLGTEECTAALGAPNCSGDRCQLPSCSNYQCSVCDGRLGTEGCTGGAGATRCSNDTCISEDDDEDECDIECSDGVDFLATTNEAASLVKSITDDAIDNRGFLIRASATGYSMKNNGYEYSAIRIATKKQLQAIAKTINAGMIDSNGIPYSRYTIVLGKNINLCNEPWTPIGTQARAFYGAVYGNGHKICNLNVNSNNDNQGFLGYVDSTYQRLLGDTVKDLALENISVKGDENVGGLAGKIVNGGRISNSYTAGTVSASTVSGGLVGDFPQGSITWSYSTANVSSNAGADIAAGGLVGYTNQGIVIEDSYASGNVTGAGDGEVGGLVGTEVEASSSVPLSIIRSHYSGGTLIGDAVGGLVGGVYSSYANSKIEDSTVTSATIRGLNGTVGYSVGGVIGYTSVGGSQLNIRRSHVINSNISGNRWVGGFIGTQTSTNISQCSVRGGSVSSNSSSAEGIGGFVGFLSSTFTSKGNIIDQCYSSAEVFSVGYYGGGFTGSASNSGRRHEITNCYSTGDVYGGGIGGFGGHIKNTYIQNSFQLGRVYSVSGMAGNIAYDYDKNTTRLSNVYYSYICPKTCTICAGHEHDPNFFNAEINCNNADPPVTTEYMGNSSTFMFDNNRAANTPAYMLPFIISSPADLGLPSEIWEKLPGKLYPTLRNNPEP